MIQSSIINNNELLVEVNEKDLIKVIQFHENLMKKLKFRQLIDIAGVDYPDKEKRFQHLSFYLMRIIIE